MTEATREELDDHAKSVSSFFQKQSDILHLEKQVSHMADEIKDMKEALSWALTTLSVPDFDKDEKGYIAHVCAILKDRFGIELIKPEDVD